MLLECGAAAVAGGVAVSALIRERKRSAMVRAIAARLHLKYLGTSLPRSLELAGTEVANLSSAWNVVDGERRGIRVVTFDCRIGTGKGSWRTTVIAARTATNCFTGRSSHLIVQRAGEWLLHFEPRSFSLVPGGLMPPSELSAYLEGI